LTSSGNFLWGKAPILRFRDAEAAKGLARAIREEALSIGRPVRVMHFCGTHEHTASGFGIRSLLPDSVKLIAGPGCPVCVLSEHEIREAIEVARRGAILCSYGDVVRVPTKEGSLFDAKREGADVRVVYSFADAIEVARRNPRREVVFFSVGFETTAAPTAALILSLVEGGDSLPPNLSLLTAHRLTPPVMRFLVEEMGVDIDGVIAPGHVCTVMGPEHFKEFPERYGIPTVVAGFEPLDLLLGLLMCLRQIREGRAELENEYTRSAKPGGRKEARRALLEAFDVVSGWWRGIGVVPDSICVLKGELKGLDARERFGVSFEPEPDEIPEGCICHLIVTGRALPTDCPHFGKGCTPHRPKGPCMVSSEGTCLAWFRYGPQGWGRLRLSG